MPKTITQQAERFYRAVTQLVRTCQCRDRDQICCHGISVTQCYALDTLDVQGALTMGELAGELHLEKSTATRAIDALEEKKLVTRVCDADDRRVCRISLTAKGLALVTKIRDEAIGHFEEALAAIPRDSRDAAITAITRLLDSCQCCDETSEEKDAAKECCAESCC